MRKALARLPRFIVTPVVAKHRIFAWRSTPTLAMNLLVVIARSTTMQPSASCTRVSTNCGRCASVHGSASADRSALHPDHHLRNLPLPARPHPARHRPQGWRTPPPRAWPTPSSPANIAAPQTRPERVARSNWLNPPEWTDWVITPQEEAAGFPKRPVAKPGLEAELKKRTLTNLYNARPAWLALAHEAAGQAAVATAYGWTDYTPEMADEEILRRLLALNLERAAG
jgi:hypothetical protein